jgi:flavin-dependent dehydrogenase
MRCDVLVVGGGPAGSTCATRLVRAGLDVIILDRAAFPRDKVCAGWITPAVVDLVGLDVDEYARGRTCQPFLGFRTGSFDRAPILTAYEWPISYGIRRCEFDEYLLRRSRARLVHGQVTSLARERDRWLINASVESTVVIGAGGHFCPVARHLNPGARHEAVVAAQEIEFRVAQFDAGLTQIRGEWPELYFWPDLLGYGWCVRKGEYLNIGAGRLEAAAFPAAVAQFKTWLQARGLMADVPPVWKGHAYLLNRTSTRRVTGDGVALIGDAAGLALAPSGEGILAAVESGLMAADSVLEAFDRGAPHQLDGYAARLANRFGARAPAGERSHWPAWITRLAAGAIFSSRWMTRRVLIEDAFLHQRRRPLAAG